MIVLPDMMYRNASSFWRKVGLAVTTGGIGNVIESNQAKQDEENLAKMQEQQRQAALTETQAQDILSGGVTKDDSAQAGDSGGLKSDQGTGGEINYLAIGGLVVLVAVVVIIIMAVRGKK